MELDQIRACSDDELAVAIEQVHALLCSTKATLLELIVHFDTRQAYRTDGATNMASWLVGRLSVSTSTARDLVDMAQKLSALPALAASFAEAKVSYDQVRPVARVATPETDESFAAALPSWSAAQAESAARIARDVPPADVEEAHRRRSLRLWEEGQSLRLSGRLDAEPGAMVRAYLERLAEQYGPNPDTGLFDPYEARLADSLVAACSAGVGADDDPDRATVVVHVDANVLAGEDGAGETERKVPLSREVIRRLLCDSRLQLVADDELGQPVGVGRTSRTAPAWLVRQVRRRDGGCRFPGCGRRRLVHAHHIVHWADGGPTDLCNLVGLCRYHHRLLHEGSWRIDGDPNGELRFIRPPDRILSSSPAPLRPDVARRFDFTGVAPTPVATT